MFANLILFFAQTRDVEDTTNNDTAFGVNFDDFQSESDDLDDDQIVLDDEAPTPGTLNIPCGYCTCTVSIEQ